jgi:hypothetical protein
MLAVYIPNILRNKIDPVARYQIKNVADLYYESLNSPHEKIPQPVLERSRLRTKTRRKYNRLLIKQRQLQRELKCVNEELPELEKNYPWLIG